MATTYTGPVIPAAIEPLISQRAKDLLQKVWDFVDTECIPAEALFHHQISTDPAKRWASYPQIIEELKEKAKKAGLWNLWLHKGYKEGPGLTNVEYALMAEIMGRAGHVAPEAMNCAAPDTGNMEVFAKYGNDAQKKQWLVPLMNGEIRSAFAMTERFISSSDATNIQTSIRREGDEYVINGNKWWISGAGDPRCKIYIVMGKTDAGNPNPHKQQSIVLVPAGTPGVNIVRPMHIMGYDDAPHGHMEMTFTNVRVPVSNLVLGEGRGFEIIQGRLGPGRIHHCMRTIGVAERALELMLRRLTDPTRKTFGKMIGEHGTVQADVAESRMEIDSARFMVLNAAHMIDLHDAKSALREIGMAKIICPSMALRVIDRAQQAYGAEGICQDTVLPNLWTHVRTLRYADGPDEVHRAQVAKLEMRRAKAVVQKIEEQERRSAMLLGQKAKL
ncbi:acyl-CoA dehydrogenase NM domain-like protein [Saitoella complicata NRRL Y-17804]|uniref:Acyl-CoA dehydrogenase/oxidase C-terminal domain-containing protein n=1 Tax=Saitoella complicata (strain BCRC 22490 / CBS 7301 / JCM 7358 / NBRC 10748 / NRRL Y-17804) TaxID=698492 RepID=A0A0E9NKB7_SAICN|nr:acyl-CoA dehydrogenase NM domain-like protein [Saitoella complicata NRRL Y-17804]ODQ54500.1 acyl-CoA dehydrogenase NM domain-like protein [Saitoella complicata NRRL Y-17804]GAO50131.1 hypothetical protein G7K_4266-t1 [Saitoella complicata NRRL Y-17804]